MVVELFADLGDEPAQVAEVEHHAGGRVGLATERDFGVVGVAVHAPAADGFDLALQRVGRVEKEALAHVVGAARHAGRRRQGVWSNRQVLLHRMPVTLCVCTLSFHAGCAMQAAMQSRVLAACELGMGPSIGCR
jgi:hypothetical protein